VRSRCLQAARLIAGCASLGFGGLAKSHQYLQKLFKLAKFEQALDVGQGNPGIGMGQASVKFF
jgi:hypothetical protein